MSDRFDIIIENTLVQDEKTKSKGYNVVNCKQKLDVGSLEILKGSRGNTSKKHGEKQEQAKLFRYR